MDVIYYAKLPALDADAYAYYNTKIPGKIKMPGVYINCRLWQIDLLDSDGTNEDLRGEHHKHMISELKEQSRRCQI